jgi:F420H(2)-dependent quinone reductase
MSTKRERAPRVPPRWFIRAAWVVHRGMYRASGGRFGLRRARPDRWGMLSLTTTGRRTGRTHRVIIGYIEDGQNLVTMAMNGWGEGEPAWWLNLQARYPSQAHRRTTRRQGARRARSGTSSAVGGLASDRPEPRCLRRTSLVRDGNRGARAAGFRCGRMRSVAGRAPRERFSDRPTAQPPCGQRLQAPSRR